MLTRNIRCIAHERTVYWARLLFMYDSFTTCMPIPSHQQIIHMLWSCGVMWRLFEYISILASQSTKLGIWQPHLHVNIGRSVFFGVNILTHAVGRPYKLAFVNLTIIADSVFEPSWVIDLANSKNICYERAFTTGQTNCLLHAHVIMH